MYLIESEQEPVFTVSGLNKTIRQLLETNFPHVWVEGEISNFAAPGSGHWYFSLKDETAQVRCAMFKGSQRRLDFQPTNGSHVLIKARVSLYENRGEFQLLVEGMEERGEGKLRKQLEFLKKKLNQLGLFDSIHKKSLPLYATQIGVVTSPTGAAIRDILHVLKRRYAHATIIIYPTLVQGALAAPAICNAIALANKRKECEVLIIARGGGSLEDLWAFNEEIVAQAIFQSDIPIISGIGHEIDFTIADFVADVRAPTPSAAAEIATPDQAEILQTLLRQYKNLERFIKQQLQQSSKTTHHLQNQLRLQHPKRRLIEKMQFLDHAEQTLMQLQQRLLHILQNKLTESNRRLHLHKPAHHIAHYIQQLNLNYQKLTHRFINLINQKEAELKQAAGQLHALSPLATLNRGYAIVSSMQQKVIRKRAEVHVGEQLTIRLAEGSLQCTVEEIH